MSKFNVRVGAIEISTGAEHFTTITVEAKDGSEANWKALDQAKELYPADKFRNHTAR